MTVSSIAEYKQVHPDLLSFKKTHYQLPPDELIKQTISHGEGMISDSGALIIGTGEFTGRSPKDKYIVKDELTSAAIDWNNFNIPLQPERFDAIFSSAVEYLSEIPEVWVRDCYACADPKYRVNFRVVNEKPWGNLFAYNMFLRPEPHEPGNGKPEWHLIAAPGLKLDPEECGTRQPHAAVISFRHKMIIIAGTGYTGEIKKAIFTILNFLLPQHHDVLSMHCAANMSDTGDTALFFGLSGTGKTTLSADDGRRLIGDDEHGWNDRGVFNFEGGCYAKVINLCREREPQIFNAIRDGSMLENTICFPGTNRVNYSSSCVTENTRVSYPINFVENAQQPSVGNIPSNIFFLTCDAYGVLPPLSRLTPEQAMYYFISGYTAKIAGTEAGITEPASTFSACFGAPFMPLHPVKYAEMLGHKIKKHHVNVWMVNTGWTGGAYGSGSRIQLDYTRAMIRAAMNRQLQNVEYDIHPVFKIHIPVACAGVPSEIVYPRDTWADKDTYDAQAATLAKKFTKNFEKYDSFVDIKVRSAGPVI
jgi:phosphoenolpyruvate carboxykinase (ATP)